MGVFEIISLNIKLFLLLWPCGLNWTIFDVRIHNLIVEFWMTQHITFVLIYGHRWYLRNVIIEHIFYINYPSHVFIGYLCIVHTQQKKTHCIMYKMYINTSIRLKAEVSDWIYCCHAESFTKNTLFVVTKGYKDTQSCLYRYLIWATSTYLYFMLLNVRLMLSPR